MRLWTFAVALLLIPSSALAQQSPESALAALGFKVAKPMSADQLAKTKARVAAELTRSGSAAFFDDVSDAYGGKARHRPSGLVCPLGQKGQHIVEASADGAICRQRGSNDHFDSRVQRAPAGATLQSVAATALTAAQREPGYKPYQGASVNGHPQTGSGRPDHQTFRFTSKVEGRERASRVQMGIVHGWILTERRVTPNTGAQPMGMAEIFSEASFGRSMSEAK